MGSLTMSAQSNFLMWDGAKVGNSCVVGGLCDVPDVWQLLKGYSRLRHFPNDASMRMDRNYPKLVGLVDNLRNESSLIVGSGELVAHLSHLKGVEFLPVTIIDHKNKAASRPYFIVNPVTLQHCLNIGESNCTFNKIIPEDVDWVERIVLDEEAVDPEVSLFRVKKFSHLVFLRRSLAEELRAAALTGVRFTELDQYEGYKP